MSAERAIDVGEPDYEDRLRELLRMFLKGKKITHKRAAAHLGITSSMLSERLNGPTKIPWSEIVKLADLVDVSLDVLKMDPHLLGDPDGWVKTGSMSTLSLLDPVAVPELPLDWGRPQWAVDNRPTLVGATQ